MTDGELSTLLAEPFYGDFAETVARQVRDADAVGTLYGLVASPETLARSVRHKVLFRGTYVLEKIYFGNPALFMPYVDAFFADFPSCADASARRHFAKIMAHVLRERLPAVEMLGPIADSAARWAIDPASKIAVRIWAVEVLKCCRERIGWVAESWDDLICAMEQDATPGIRSRMRRSWS